MKVTIQIPDELEQKLTELTQSAADQSSFGELGMYINIMKK